MTESKHMSAPNTTRGPEPSHLRDLALLMNNARMSSVVREEGKRLVAAIEAERDSALARADAAEKRVRELEALIEAADQKLSGIQYYSDCKTARTEAGLVRRDLRSSFLPRTPEAS